MKNFQMKLLKTTQKVCGLRTFVSSLMVVVLCIGLILQTKLLHQNQKPGERKRKNFNQAALLKVGKQDMGERLLIFLFQFRWGRRFISVSSTRNLQQTI